MIDNIFIIRNEGSAVGGSEIGTGMDMVYQTAAPAVYQLQATEDLTSGIWIASGPLVLGDGTAKSALGSTLGAAHRSFRVVVF
jgi:hypothetical protein